MERRTWDTFGVATNSTPTFTMRSTLLALSSFTFLGASAQWTTPDVNTRVSGNGNVSAATPMSAPGPEGSTYITWFEAATGYRLMMQRLDANGLPLWAAGGIVVSDEPQNSALFRYDLASDNAGNAIVAFQDERTGTLDIVAYRVAPDASMLWGDGITLPTPDSDGLAPVIGVLNDDRVVIAWNTGRSPSTVAYRILPTSGVPAAADPAEITGVGSCGRPRIVPNSDGGFWIQYAHQQGSFLNPATMLAKRFDDSGAEVGAVTVSTATISGFYFPASISDGHNGFYIAFNSGNASNANLTDVYVQRVRGDGSTWSATGTAVEIGATTNRYANNTAPALLSDLFGIAIAYSRKDANQTTGGINVQRFDTAGTAMLGNAGALVVAPSNALPEPFGTVAYTGMHALFAYTIGGFGAETAHAIVVDQNGAADAQFGTIAVATTASGIDDAALVPFVNGSTVAIWQDDRFGGSVLAQNIVVDNGASIAERSARGVQLLHGDQLELLFTETYSNDIFVTTHSVDGKRLGDQRIATPLSGSRVALALPPHAHGMVLISVSDLRGHVVLKGVVH